MELSEIASVIGQQGEAFAEFKHGLDARLRELELKHARAALFGPATGGAIGDPGELKALDQAVRALVAGDQAKAERAFVEAKAMSAGSGPDGGYVVHPVLSAGMTRVMLEISPVYRLARKVPMTTGDAFEEPVDRDTAGAVWVGEQDDRGDTDTPQLGLFRVPLNEIAAQPKVTQKLVDTGGIDVVQWLTAKVGAAFAVAEGQAFHDGNGVAKPRGFLTHPTSTASDATRAWGTIQHIATGASGAFPTASTSVNSADVLVDLMSALKAQYRDGAVWLMNRATAGVVRKLKDADGRHVWIDSLVLGQPAALLGFPVEIDEAMPDIAAGSLSIAFGNVGRAYTVIEQPGIRFLADPYTSKPNMRLFSYRRVGGGLNNSEAIKLLKFS